MSIITENDLQLIKEFHEIHKFKGFDVAKIKEEFESKIPDKRTQIEILTILSCNSPKRASDMILRNGKSLSQMGIIHGNRKGLSPARIISVYAKDIISIRRMTKETKRIDDMKCPAEFQILGITRAIPPNMINDYKAFCMEFSKLIRGSFSEELFLVSQK